MKFTKETIKNIIFLIIILLIIIPQTRKPIQVFLQKGVMLINKPSIDKKDTLVKFTDYNCNLINGSNAHYSRKEAKGKVILISFWATWCPALTAEVPSSQKLYDDYNEKV